MNYLIITFPNHEVYTYLKLIVDNFYLDAAVRKTGPGILKQDASSTENGRTPGVWEFELDRRMSCAPGARWTGKLSTGYSQLRGSLGV